MVYVAGLARFIAGKVFQTKTVNRKANMKRLGIGIAIATALVAIGAAQANAPNDGRNAAVVSAELVIQNNIDMSASFDSVALANIVSAPEHQSPALTSWTCTFAINCVDTIGLKGVRGDVIYHHLVAVPANGDEIINASAITLIGANNLAISTTTGAFTAKEGVGDLILPNSNQISAGNSFGVAETSNSEGGALVGTELVLTAVQSAFNSTA